MRVAVVAERTIHHAETTATVRASRLASGLAKRGHEVTVFCSQWWDDDEGTMTVDVDGVTHRAVTRHPSVPDLRFAARLPHAIGRFGPDVIHALHHPPVAVLGAGIAGRIARAPLLVDWYANDSRSGWTERARRLAARVPDRVIVPSRLVRRGVRELTGRAEGIERIPDPVDMNAIHDTNAESIGDIVYARRLDGDAGLESLFLALAELREFDWSLVVIGDGPKREACERRATDYRIDDRVRFLGSQPIERRIAIMKGAQVAVHTAHRAPSAPGFLRALACGCVGIAVYRVASSAHEHIETYPRGIRVGNDYELAGAIQQAAAMDHRTIEPWFSSFDTDAVLDRHLACYRDLREN